MHGENVHLIRTWVFLYKMSKEGSNDRKRYELFLRQFVATGRVSLALRRQVLNMCELMTV
jgi:hypothetical protein